MVQFAKLLKGNDQVSQMVWEDLRSKHGLSESFSRKGKNSEDSEDSG
eukprot:CAMPEP_0194257048 /NCGR_PEP_ID=MMETSP0158-20130606/38136_1 /TAXON_ID=33649 /ORGANISM="Thalassionema nitzschioides, Strain L26-B" /LENGTH=46 /DNA_ID= /DNA_START= /DNA_END= /DNA_ORIENTATION=